MDYLTFMRHAAKICSSPHLTDKVDRYKILKGVFHHENGSLICTDAHRLYVAKDKHSRTDNAVITPKGKVLEGKFPDVSRIIPDKSNARQEIAVNVNELLQGVDMAYSTGKLMDDLEGKVIVRFENGKMYFKHPMLSVKHEVGFSFESKMSFNAKYLLDALKMFKADKNETVTFYYFGSMRPLLIENGNLDLLALILPVRIY